MAPKQLLFLAGIVGLVSSFLLPAQAVPTQPSWTSAGSGQALFASTGAATMYLAPVMAPLQGGSHPISTRTNGGINCSTKVGQLPSCSTVVVNDPCSIHHAIERCSAYNLPGADDFCSTQILDGQCSARQIGRYCSTYFGGAGGRAFCSVEGSLRGARCSAAKEGGCSVIGGPGECSVVNGGRRAQCSAFQGNSICSVGQQDPATSMCSVFGAGFCSVVPGSPPNGRCTTNNANPDGCSVFPAGGPGMCSVLGVPGPDRPGLCQ